MPASHVSAHHTAPEGLGCRHNSKEVSSPSRVVGPTLGEVRPSV